MQSTSVPGALPSAGLSSSLVFCIPSPFWLFFLPTFVSGRKCWICYLQYLFSPPPPPDSQQPVFSHRKSWNLNKQCMKMKLEAALSTVVEPGNDYHSHLSSAPLTRTQNFNRKQNMLIYPPPDSSFHHLLLSVRFNPFRHDIHWHVTSWCQLMTLLSLFLTNKWLVTPSLLLNTPGQSTATLKFYSQRISSG